MSDAELSALLADLSGGDPDRALKAFEQLKNRNAGDLPAHLTKLLDAAMERKDFLVRDLTCELLLKVQRADALPTVLEAMLPDLGDDQDSLSFLVSELVSMEPAATKPTVIQYLLDPRPEARATATWALGFLQDPEALSHLEVAVTDPAPEVRAQAFGALGSFTASTGVIDLMISAFEDPDADVRLNAISALGYSESPVAVPPLLKSLKDSDARVRRLSAYALGQLGFRDAEQDLLRASASDPDPEVQAAAESAWRRITGGGRR